MREKYILQAPDGVEESNIEGTMYWPDPENEGRIETTNVRHKDVLIRHGYTLDSTVSIMAPAQVKGPIDHEEMGRSQLASSLKDRGVSYPENGSREELVSIAAAWNQARLRRSGKAADPAPAPAPQPVAAAPAPQPHATAETPPSTPQGGGAAPADTAVDFTASSYDELKGWLVGHGVAFPANTPKKRLVEMCQEAYAALVAKRQAA